MRRLVLSAAAAACAALVTAQTATPFKPGTFELPPVVYPMTMLNVAVNEGIGTLTNPVAGPAAPPASR